MDQPKRPPTAKDLEKAREKLAKAKSKLQDGLISSEQYMDIRRSLPKSPTRLPRAKSFFDGPRKAIPPRVKSPGSNSRRLPLLSSDGYHTERLRTTSAGKQSGSSVAVEASLVSLVASKSTSKIAKGACSSPFGKRVRGHPDPFLKNIGPPCFRAEGSTPRGASGTAVVSQSNKSDLINTILAGAYTQGIPIHDFLMAMGMNEGSSSSMIHLQNIRHGLKSFDLHLTDSQFLDLRCLLNVDMEGRIALKEFEGLIKAHVCTTLSGGESSSNHALHLVRKNRNCSKIAARRASKLSLHAETLMKFNRYIKEHKMRLIDL